MAINPTLSNKLINLNFNNDSNNDLDLKLSISRQQNLLDNNSSLYDVFLQRFYIDSSKIDSFRITPDNQADYWVGINSLDGTGRVNGNPTSLNQVFLPTYLTNRLRSEQDFLDIFNSSLNQVYSNYLGKNRNKNSQFYTATFSDTVSTQTFTMSTITSPNYDVAVDYQFRIDSITVSSNNNIGLFTFILKNNTTGDQVILCKNGTLDMQSLTFADWGNLNYDQRITGIALQSAGLLTNVVKPDSPFYVIKNKTGNGMGSWSLICYPTCPTSLSSGATYSFTVNGAFAIQELDVQKPIIDSFYPPYLELDQSTQLLQWRYNENFRASSYDIYVSPKIFAMIGFPGTYDTVLTSGAGGFKIRLPSNIMFTGPSNTLSQSNFLTFRQNVSTIQNLCDIEAIQFSTSLSIEYEANETTNQKYSVLTSFLIDAYSATSYSYNATENNRRYRLTQSGELTSFDIFVYIKRKNILNADNNRELVRIGPGMYANLLLNFQPIQ